MRDVWCAFVAQSTVRQVRVGILDEVGSIGYERLDVVVAIIRKRYVVFVLRYFVPAGYNFMFLFDLLIDILEI